MKRLMITLMLFIGISSVVMAVGGEHGQQVNWDELNLTKQQANEINSIRKEYRDQFQELRKHAIDKNQKKQEMLLLRQTMLAGFERILSEKQNQKMNKMMLDQQKKRVDKRLGYLAGKLALTPEQKQSIHSLVSNNLADNTSEFLIDDLAKIKKKQQILKQMDQVMTDILSRQQLEKWQKIKGQRERNQALYS